MPGDPVWFRLVLPMAAHEVATTAWMKRPVGAGMIACDVGAHIGYHTVRLARLVGQQGSVFAFESNAETATVLRLNASRFGNVTVVDCAVSDFNGEATLLPSGGDTSTHRLGGDAAEKGNLTGRGNRVSVRRLDDWAVEAGLHHIDFVEVDAEGQDAAVLRGGASILASGRTAAIVECAPHLLAQAGSGVQDLVDVMKDLFGSVYVILGPSPAPRATGDLVYEAAGASGYVNLLRCGHDL